MLILEIELDTEERDIDYVLEEFKRHIDRETLYNLKSIKVSRVVEYKEPPCQEPNQ